MIVLVVDLKCCEGKGDCVIVCFENVFEVWCIDEVDYFDFGLMYCLKLCVYGMKVVYMLNV